MFILLFNLPAGPSADGISDGQPFKTSSDALKANERSDYPASDAFTGPQAVPARRAVLSREQRLPVEQRL